MTLSDHGWELLATVVAIALAFAAPNFGAGFVRQVLRPFRRLAMHPRAAVLFVGLTNLALTVSLAFSVGLPRPAVHDEFAYALTADTFAHGRLTNPTHPMWKHFESYHIFHTPSYQAKYPPAQGLVMALGQVVTGFQIAGVWVSLALACGAVCWMLQAWTRPRWALFGGLLTSIHPAIVLTWGETYWGGAVAMLGGALVFGALPRLTTNARFRDAVALGVGLVLLANSRPYEGLVASLPVAFVLGLWLLGEHTIPRRTRIGKVAVPIAVILAVSGTWMGYYNHRVTGNPLKMPYQHWMHEYSTGTSMSELLWRVDNGRKGSRPDFESASLAEGVSVNELTSVQMNEPILKTLRYYLFFWRIPLSIALLSLPALLSRQRLWLPIGCYVAVWMAVMINHCSGWCHYYAPATALFVLIVVEGLRRVRTWKFSTRRYGRILATAAPLILLLSVLRQFAVAEEKFAPVGTEWLQARTLIEKELTATGEKHLILVRYSAGHNTGAEWVYNPADIDAAAVLWARPGAPEETLRLAEYFKDRSIWTIEADKAHPRRPELFRWSPPVEEAETPETGDTHRQVTSLEPAQVHSAGQEVSP